MMTGTSPGRHPFTRSVFTGGEYVDLFRPEDRHNPFRHLYAAKRDAVVEIVGRLPAGRVLDLGGGPGRMAVPLAQHHHVTLADISEEMLELARRTAAAAGIQPSALQTVRLDAGAALPFGDRSFDAAIAVDLICHLPDPTATLRELSRVVAPGGLILAEASNRNALWMLRYPTYVGRRPARWLQTWRAGGVLPEWAATVTHHSHREFQGMLADAGLRVVEERTFGPSLAPKHFLAVCRTDP